MPTDEHAASEPSTAKAAIEESDDTTRAAQDAQDAPEASRDAAQTRIVDLGGGGPPAGTGADDGDEKTDMSAVGDDGQVFGG